MKDSPTVTKARRIPALLACAALFALPGTAGAQLFWQPPDLSTAPLTGTEPESGVNLPGATPAELDAGLLWSLRAALNVAALQCDFEPTLLTTSNYNAMLAQHRTELASSFKVLGDYFRRVHGAVPGQKQFDQYGTRVYSGYSTVGAQRSFCQVAGRVGRDAIFAPRGTLTQLARNNIGALRRGLVAHYDPIYGNPGYGFALSLPSLDKRCWKNEQLLPKCAENWASAAAK
ncbi:MAG: hypothetical protein ABW184_08770 [Sphingobium sp.]